MSRSLPEWRGKTADTKVPPHGRRICSVDGCEKTIDCHGFCASHARRFIRHGNPLGGTTPRGACVEFMNEIAIKYTGDDCLQWPFGHNGKGYGAYHVNGRTIGAHVYVCEKVYGPKPSPCHEAAHNCGKGHLLCCNPKHLRWATTKENHADKVGHGTVTRGEKNPSNRLTPTDVLLIRQLIGTLPQHQIARRFGVCQMTISHINSGRTWGWLK